MSEVIVACRALTASGWRHDVAITLQAGKIAAIEPSAAPHTVDVLLPAPGNLHSHAFQRAMAGLTEQRRGSDDFWSWRALMYRFLEALGPDDVEAIAAGVQMEMLEAGFAAVGEFHYLHNPSGGGAYDAPAELATRIVAAAERTGIGLTLLPVVYTQGGMDGRPLEGGQMRFSTPPAHFSGILDGARDAIRVLGDDARVGVAPHSLRAVPAGLLRDVAGLPGPKHIHVAEQVREVEEVRAHTGATPVRHLAASLSLSSDWTLIHATHTDRHELALMANAGATVGLCPITESNLGDGLFDAVSFLGAGGMFGVGSDSNIRISLVEELRTLDYGQRLLGRVRNPLSGASQSSGRRLWSEAAKGAARALHRGSGEIAVGSLADLVALNGSTLALDGLDGDTLLDAHIFAGDGGAASDVWAAGRHVVREGEHRARSQIERAFRATLQKLRASV